MRVSLRSVEPISLPHVPRDDAMDFLRHFGRETFEFPLQPGCVLLHTLKNAYPRHSFADGWLLSLTWDQLQAVWNDDDDVEKLQEYIVGTLHLEVGGSLAEPTVSVTVKEGLRAEPVPEPQSDGWQPIEELLHDNNSKLLSLGAIATFMRLLRLDKEAEAYDYFVDLTNLYTDADTAQRHLSDVSITPEDWEPGLELLKHEGFLEQIGSHRYRITTYGLYGVYCVLGHLCFRREAYEKAAWCYGQAYQMDRGQSDMLQHQAQCYLKLRQWNFARIQLGKCLQQAPDTLEAHLLLCQVNSERYEESHSDHDREDAWQAYQAMIQACHRILQENPENEQASSILKAGQHGSNTN